MSKGPSTLKEIAKPRKEEDSVEAKVAKLGGRLAELRAQEIAAFRDLAAFRFGEAGDSRVSGTLDRAEMEIRRLKAARETALEGVGRELEAAIAEIGRLEADRTRLGKEIAELQATIDETDERLIAELADNADYKALLDAVDKAEHVAVEAERKAELANEDRAEKGQPYEDDALFMYLWRRGYGTSAYKGRGLIRTLDSWVARLVRYHDARPNYHMLLELPKRLGEHAERAREAATAEADRLEDFEAAHRAEAGILDQAKKAAADEALLAEISRNLVEQTAARTALEAKRAAINRGEDETSKGAIDAVVAALQDTRLSDLHRAAMLTPDKSDERLVERIEEIREDTEDLEHDLDRLRRVERDIEKKLAELGEVRGRFVSERLDDDRWEFDDDMVEDILKGLLRGAINAAIVWAELRRRGKYTPGPTRPRGGDVWGRPSRRGGSIFRPPSGRSGGFGRGGFRTGGGFGRSGGFRTGGKF